MGKLTALGVKAATSAGRYEDGDGLALLVKGTGSRSWVLKLQVGKKRREFGLGSAKSTSLAQARENAEIKRREYKAGIDPTAEKRKVEEVPSFRDAAKRAHEEQKAGWRNPKHSAQWLSSLEAYAFPTIGDERVDKTTGPMIRDTLLPIWLDKPETARRVRQRIGAVLDRSADAFVIEGLAASAEERWAFRSTALR
jgi:hypothetical protein